MSSLRCRAKDQDFQDTKISRHEIVDGDHGRIETLKSFPPGATVRVFSEKAERAVASNGRVVAQLR
jgi:hypothetical protein